MQMMDIWYISLVFEVSNLSSFYHKDEVNRGRVRIILQGTYNWWFDSGHHPPHRKTYWYRCLEAESSWDSSQPVYFVFWSEFLQDVLWHHGLLGLSYQNRRTEVCLGLAWEGAGRRREWDIGWETWLIGWMRSDIFETRGLSRGEIQGFKTTSIWARGPTFWWSRWKEEKKETNRW